VRKRRMSGRPERSSAGEGSRTRDGALSRRDFLRRLGRILVGAGLALLALRLLGFGRKGRRGAAPARLRGERCIRKGICRGCPAYPSCGLPQALSAKRAGAKGMTTPAPGSKRGIRYAV